MEDLKVNTKIVHIVDYSDLEDFITKAFKMPNRFEILESPNDTDYTIEISDDTESQWDIDEAKKYIERCNAEYYALGTVMDYMCSRGLLKAGTYVVQVSW